MIRRDTNLLPAGIKKLSDAIDKAAQLLADTAGKLDTFLVPRPVNASTFGPRAAYRIARLALGQELHSLILQEPLEAIVGEWLAIRTNPRSKLFFLRVPVELLGHG